MRRGKTNGQKRRDAVPDITIFSVVSDALDERRETECTHSCVLRAFYRGSQREVRRGQSCEQFENSEVVATFIMH